MSVWSEKAQPVKIGTIPMLVRVHKGDVSRLAPGKSVRVQYGENGRWERVLVTRVDQDGYFMADKI